MQVSVPICVSRTLSRPDTMRLICVGVCVGLSLYILALCNGAAALVLEPRVVKLGHANGSVRASLVVVNRTGHSSTIIGVRRHCGIRVLTPLPLVVKNGERAVVDVSADGNSLDQCGGCLELYSDTPIVNHGRVLFER